MPECSPELGLDTRVPVSMICWVKYKLKTDLQCSQVGEES